jgi:UDP-N-acetylmuramate dehydrogenase
MSSNLNIQQDVILAPYTTYKIGGPAKFFVVVTNQTELAEAVKWGKEKKLPIFILGGGSNLLISDAGWPGLVIKLSISGLEFKGETVTVGSGVSMVSLAQEAAARSLSGLEWVASLPGTIGGAIRGNAGAFRFDIGQAVKSVTVWHDEKIAEMTKDECAFGYRNSIFKQANKNDIILSAVLELKAGDKEEIKKQLAGYISHRTQNLPIEPSAGCVFKNVMLTDETQIPDGLKQILPMEYIKYKKIPTAWLIEQAGLKGAKVGGAEVSGLHANFILNTHGATAKDVLELIRQIKEKVYNKFNINLSEEIQII